MHTMKSSTRLLISFGAVWHLSSTQAQTVLVGSGSSYTSPFAPADSITYNVPGGGLLSLTVANGTASKSSGIWNLSAQGGANISLLGLGLVESQAQTQLTGSALNFSVDNSPSSLLGSLGTGASIHYGWNALATFGSAGSVLDYAANTTYQVSFHVDGNNGLLNSVAGVTPSFNFELVDGSGNPLTDISSGTLINIAGLLGTGVPSGDITLDYTVGGTAPTGPIGVEFIGDATVGASALGLGTDFATVSNLSITASPVPEPGGGLFVGSVGMLALLHRRRLGWRLEVEARRHPSA